MILKAGDPRLIKVEADDIDFDSPAFKKDLSVLINVLHAEGGMGIAAPQLGISRRLLIIESKPNSRYPNAPETPMLIMVNPYILEKSLNEEIGWEGCLSVPAKRVRVKRASSVKVKYQDQAGREQIKELSGFIARIFLHEFDHIEGITILDRALSNDDVIAEKDYFEMMS